MADITYSSGGIKASAISMIYDEIAKVLALSVKWFLDAVFSYSETESKWVKGTTVIKKKKRIYRVIFDWTKWFKELWDKKSIFLLGSFQVLLINS